MEGHGVLPSSQPWLGHTVKFSWPLYFGCRVSAWEPVWGWGWQGKASLEQGWKLPCGCCPSSWRGCRLAGSGCDLWWGRITILSAVRALFSGGYALDAGRVLKVLDPGKTVCVPDLPPAPLRPWNASFGKLGLQWVKWGRGWEMFAFFTFSS